MDSSEAEGGFRLIKTLQEESRERTHAEPLHGEGAGILGGWGVDASRRVFQRVIYTCEVHGNRQRLSQPVTEGL